MRPQKDSCLRVLVWGIGQRGLMHDAQMMQAGGEFLSHHGRAVVAHECTRQGATLQRLAQTVHQALAGLVQVPLNVAGEPRAIVEHRERHRRDPDALAGKHFARSAVEVQMPQPVHMVELEAAHFARLQALAGGEHPGGGAGAGAALLEQTLRFHITPERAVGRHRRLVTQGRAQVVGMQLS